MKINELSKSIIFKKDTPFKNLLDNIIGSIKDKIWNVALLPYYIKQ